jgi:transcriptional regulator with XRE-family HTH domain
MASRGLSDKIEVGSAFLFW